VSRDGSFIEKARYLRYCGIGKSGFDSVGGKSKWWEYDIKDVFPRCLPNDLAASIGLVQLRKLEKHQARRKQIWDRYQQELIHVDWLRTPQDPLADERHSYFTYLIRVLDGRRDQLAQALLDQGIYTTLRYHPLHLNPVYRWAGPSLPNSELLNKQGLNLPLHPNLADDDVTKVIDAVKAFGRTR
jgi:aminotransferase